MVHDEILRRKERCLEFLHGENKDRPLLGVMWEPTISPILSYVRRIDLSQHAQASDVSAEEMCVACDRAMSLAEDIEQDFFCAAQASFNHLWLNAALGCRIRATPHTIWSERPGVTLEEVALLEDVESPWLDKLFECHETLVSHADGRYPVAVPWVDGPLDLLVSLIGPEQAAVDMYDRPDLILRAMDKLTAFWSKATRRLVQATPSFASGHVSRMHIWTEEPSTTVMDDATWLVSPEHYSTFVYPFEKRMIQETPDSVYHAHNTSLHILKYLAQTALKVVQLTIDTNGPGWDIQRKAIANLQQHIPVVLSCWSLSDAERARRELSPRGLALTVVLTTVQGAPEPSLVREYLRWYKECCQ